MRTIFGQENIHHKKDIPKTPLTTASHHHPIHKPRLCSALEATAVQSTAGKCAASTFAVCAVPCAHSKLWFPLAVATLAARSSDWPTTSPRIPRRTPPKPHPYRCLTPKALPRRSTVDLMGQSSSLVDGFGRAVFWWWNWQRPPMFFAFVSSNGRTFRGMQRQRWWDLTPRCHRM